MEKTISSRQRTQIYVDLIKIDPVFGKMWLTQPKTFLTDEYDTAVLEIRNKQFCICCGEKEWKSYSKADRLFAVCHEYGHIILGHWLNPGFTDCWLNLAQDIEVNEWLLSMFPKQFENVDVANVATVDSVFREKAYKVDRTKDYHYYLGLIKKCLR